MKKKHSKSLLSKSNADAASSAMAAALASLEAAGVKRIAAEEKAFEPVRCVSSNGVEVFLTEEMISIGIDIVLDYDQRWDDLSEFVADAFKKMIEKSTIAIESQELAEASQEAADLAMSRVGDIKMITPFSLLLQLSGLSHREAADFLAVRLDTVKSWSSGRNQCPDGALADMRRLISQQDRTAVETLAQIAQLQTDHGSPDVVELGEPIDDNDAQSFGWPCVGAWRGMAARVVMACPRGVTIQIVPRGSTRYYGANATNEPGQ